MRNWRWAAGICAFRIQGNQAVVLARSAWHAGPFRKSDALYFFNLELADLNVVDHHATVLERTLGVQFRFASRWLG